MTEVRHPNVKPFFDGPTPLVPLLKDFAKGINPRESWLDKLKAGWRFDWRSTRQSLKIRDACERDKYGCILKPTVRLAYAARRTEAYRDMHGYEA